MEKLDKYVESYKSTFRKANLMERQFKDMSICFKMSRIKKNKMRINERKKI